MVGESFKERLEKPYKELYGIFVLHPEIKYVFVRGPKLSLWHRLCRFMQNSLPEILLWWLLFFAVLFVGIG